MTSFLSGRCGTRYWYEKFFFRVTSVARFLCGRTGGRRPTKQRECAADGATVSSRRSGRRRVSRSSQSALFSVTGECLIHVTWPAAAAVVMATAPDKDLAELSWAGLGGPALRMTGCWRHSRLATAVTGTVFYCKTWRYHHTVKARRPAGE